MFRRVLALGASTIVIAAAAPAFASWSASASGSGISGASTLASPTITGLSCTRSNSANTITVTLAWSAASVPTGATGLTAWKRGSGSPATYVTSASLATTSTSAPDTYADDGSAHRYTYGVQTVRNNWNSVIT